MKKLTYVLIILIIMPCLALADPANQMKNIDNDIALYWKLENAYQAKCGDDMKKKEDAMWSNFNSKWQYNVIHYKVSTTEYKNRLQKMYNSGEICPIDAYQTMVTEPLARLRSK